MSNGEHKGKLLHRVEEEINEDIHPLLQKIQDNIKLIGAVLGCVVLVAAGITGYRYYKRTSLESARQTMSRIVAQNQGQAAVDALAEFLPQAPTEIKQAVRLEMARLSMSQEAFDAAASSWRQAAENASDPNIRLVAKLGQAKAYRLMGRPEQCLELLEPLVSSAPKEYTRTLHYEIAVAAEDAGQWQRALKAYEQLQAQAELTGSRGNFIDYKIGLLKERMATGDT